MSKDWEGIRLLNDSHTCYWCPTSHCAFCTHPNACIFEEEVWELNKEIAQAYKELPYVGEDIKVGKLIVNVEKQLALKKIRELEQRRRKLC